jgi:hypothetical protein
MVEILEGYNEMTYAVSFLGRTRDAENLFHSSHLGSICTKEKLLSTSTALELRATILVSLIAAPHWGNI